ncbi:MAG: hypothetical protein ABL932_14960 [Terricaulis sp.]
MDKYSDENVRAWAYDPDRTWIDDTNQDEDLTIGHLSLEILLPLVDDSACLKGDYILRCLDYHHACIIRRGYEPHHLTHTRDAMNAAKRFESEKLQDWAASLERRLSYCAGLGPTSRNRALAIAREILVDLATPGEHEVSVVCENAAAFIVERRFPNPQYWERLTIDKTTGRFTFDRATP